jgi:YidC/Oxa1 family membrane protein insertase
VNHFLLHFAAVIAAGNVIESLLKPIEDVLLAILKFGYSFLHNWGWSIVFLTVVVRIVLIPLTYRQFKSMRAMQALQPQIKALQEKYKGDRQVLNQKMMEFYQENKVNPFGSCLPLILQMPVFFALFYTLRAQTGQFAGSWWLWIRDWGPGQPWWIAKEITKFDLILLLLYVGSQFLSSMQMSLSTDSSQKAMMYLMPVGIGVVMFIGRWPAGLFIYWVTSNLWTVGQQYFITKVLPPPAPAAPATASSGGTSGQTKQRKKSPAKSGKR